MNYFIISKGIHFTANSEYLHSRLPHRIKQRCEIIYDFYDEHAKIFASYTPYQKKEYIVTVSNGFDFLKNVKNSLRAFKLIRDKYQSLNYCLIGDGMEAGGYAYLFAKKNNLLTGVDFLGPLKFTDVIDKIGCALINLHPSREESFGMSVLESQVLGTVVVGGIKSGNIPYLLDYGNAGYLCNIEDPEDITEKVIDCIENPVKRKDIEKKAKEVALEKYSSSKIIQQYLNLYERVISIEDK
jgi:glycosyltransferase involved in cell wall biosynthesis